MALVSFSAVDRSAMRWLRTSDKPLGFALSSGDATVASLQWKRHGGSLAAAETSGGIWTLKRGGFLNPHVTVRPEGSERVQARLSAHLNHHEIRLDTGTTYRFRRAGLLVPAWKVSTSEGVEVLHIEPVRQGRKLEGGAVLAPATAVDLPELLLLVVLGWYFIVLAWFEDEALLPLEGPEEKPPAPRPASP